MFNVTQESEPKKTILPAADEGESDEETTAPEPIIASEILMETIKFSVTPDDWFDTNGDATLTTIGGLLVVFGSQEQLDDVEELIDDLKIAFEKE